MISKKLSVLLCALALLLKVNLHAQLLHLNEQHFNETKTIEVKKLFEDSLCSSFIIQISAEVALHKHLVHSEHVYVISGTGKMVLGSDTFNIREGDIIFIPKNTIHAVQSTGANPLTVISIQSPRFDGTDRVKIAP